MSTITVNSAGQGASLKIGYLDSHLILAAVSLMLIGLVMISSASVDVADVRNGNPFHYVTRHGIFIVMAMCAGAFVFQVPLEWWQKSGWLCLAVSLALLFLVLLPGIGKTVNGSTRWIGFGGINLQPSELAKLLLMAYLSGYLVRRQDEIAATWWGFLKPMLVLGAAAVLLLKEPDLGATVVIGTAFIGMMFMAGAKFERFLVLLAACVGAVFILIQVQPYRMARLTGYTDPWEHAFGAGYQLTQSLIAFGRGEWFGVGLGNSVQKQFYLPEAHTDFVYAILAEEFGLFGSLLVVALFAFLVYRALVIARMAQLRGRLFEAYFCYGIAITFAVQGFINMGVNMGLLPTKGLTLPLVSYGGSSLLVSCMSIGVLLRVYADMVRDSSDEQEAEA